MNEHNKIADDRDDMIGEILRESLVERRKTRRWGIFFKFLTFAYITVAAILAFSGGPVAVSQRHVGLVDLNGVIEDRGEVSADDVVAGLTAALESKQSAGAIVRINSPGGSPVQADQIYQAIGRLRDAHPGKPVIAVIVDAGASGGYYAAAAADRIYANPSSLVGSIGVLMDGFGFVDVLNKLGVERRLITAGDNKGVLDPFSPLSEADRQHAETLLQEIHQRFIEAVRQGRGERLKDDPQIFSGLFWSGEQAMELGLIDGFASVSEAARKEFDTDELVDYSVRPNLLEEISGYIGVAAGSVVTKMLNTSTPVLR